MLFPFINVFVIFYILSYICTLVKQKCKKRGLIDLVSVILRDHS